MYQQYNVSLLTFLCLVHRYLHLAVSDGNEEFVRNLIKITPHPCLLDIQNDLLQSPLHLAVLVGNVKIVRMLLLAGAEVSDGEKDAMWRWLL